MGEIYFIRHGQASFGAENYDNLSELGHQQARWLGSYLTETVGNFDHVVSGDLKRHRQTLAGIQESLKHAEYREDPRLNEMAFFIMERTFREKTGGKEPDTPHEMEQHFRLVMHAWEDGGIESVPESYPVFQNRIISAVNEIAKHGKRTLIVSSGGPVGIMMRHVLGLDLAATTEIILGTHNASITRFSVLENGLRLKQYNGVPHLEATDRRHALTFL